MYKSQHQIRVRYGETDQMGVVYYGNYALYLEEARTSCIRELGVSYRQMEEQGIMLPVVQMNIRYKGPARYDDLLTIETRIEKMPGRTIEFEYRILNEQGDVLNEATTILVFMEIATKKVTKAPQFIIDALSPYIA